MLQIRNEVFSLLMSLLGKDIDLILVFSELLLEVSDLTILSDHLVSNPAHFLMHFIIL
jgi:hypothetical protein